MLVHPTHVVCCALCTPHHTCIYMYVVPEPHLMHVYMYNPTSFSNLLDFIRFEQPCTCTGTQQVKTRHQDPPLFSELDDKHRRHPLPFAPQTETPYLLHHKRTVVLKQRIKQNRTTHCLYNNDPTIPFFVKHERSVPPPLSLSLDVGHCPANWMPLFLPATTLQNCSQKITLGP